MKNGIYTRNLGNKLYEKYFDTSYVVYYDPHRKKRNDEPNAFQPTPFFDECNEATTLSHTDIVIINKEKKLVELVVEIEESGAVPKKIIGDIGNIMLSDQIRINGEDYHYGNVIFIFGAIINAQGKSKEKIERICKKLIEINEKVGKKNLQIKTVIDSDFDGLIKKIEQEISTAID